MEIDIENLPSDTESLKKIIFALQNSLQEVVTEKDLEIEKLRHQLQLAIIKRFGSSSEKISPDQIRLFDEAKDLSLEEKNEIEEVEEILTIPEHQRKKRSLRSLPQSLPREQVIHDLSEDEKKCSCGYELHKMTVFVNKVVA